MTDKKENDFDPFKIPDTPMVCGEWYAWWSKAEPIFRKWKEAAEEVK